MLSIARLSTTNFQSGHRTMVKGIGRQVHYSCSGKHMTREELTFVDTSDTATIIRKLQLGRQFVTMPFIVHTEYLAISASDLPTVNQLFCNATSLDQLKLSDGMQHVLLPLQYNIFIATRIGLLHSMLLLIKDSFW